MAQVDPAAEGGRGFRGRGEAVRGGRTFQGPREGAGGETAQDGRHGHPHHGSRLFAMALHVAHRTGDAELYRLIDASLVSRQALINAEQHRLEAVKALVEAVKSGDEERIEAAKERVHAATEALHEAAKKLREDFQAIAERLRELRPQIQEEMQTHRRRERAREEPADAMPPELY